MCAALGVALAACQTPVELPKSDAQSGFEVNVDGFSFPNFGGDSQTARLTPALVARMFGPERVCTTPEAECRLTPLANQWMSKVNASMRGGRCEGFAVLSGLFYQQVLRPEDFGAKDAFDLDLRAHPPLSREIAYWFSTQFLRDVVRESTHSLDARGAAAFLSTHYQKVPIEDLYRVGIVRVGDDGKVTGGHAMVATAVLVDEVDKRFRIQVYDNNHPGEARFILVDAQANRWEYQASRTPDAPLSLYQGTTDNHNLLYLAPLKNRTGKQRCSFCGLSDDQAETALNQIFSFGSVEVAAVDAQGHATGVLDGRFVNTLPGASLSPNFSVEPWEDPMPPIVFVPALTHRGGALRFRVAGTGGSEAMHMTMFGAGFSVGVSGAAPPQGASDVVTVSNGGTRVSVERALNAGGEFTVSAIAQTADGGQTEVQMTIPADAGHVDLSTMALDPRTGNAAVEAHGHQDVDVAIAIVRSSSGEEVVIEGTVTAPAGGSLSLNISGYSQDAGVLEVTVDEDGDGTPEMTLPVENYGPQSPPAPPDALSATAVASNRVQLTWHDTSRYEDHFVVERALGAGAFTQLVELPADTEAHLDTLVVASSAYRYRVRATSAFGASAWTSEVSVTSPDCPPGTQDFDHDGTCETSCAVTTCDAHATCSDAVGPAICTCASGFSGDGTTCADVDECLTDHGGCGDAEYTTCVNNPGAAPTCVDIDECATNNGGCGDAPYTACTNNRGAPPTCADTDECATNNGGCGDARHMACTNNLGAAPTCTDIDECATNNGGCGLPSAATCTDNVAAPPTCSCQPGHTGALCATPTEFVVSPSNTTTSETVLDLVRDTASNLYVALMVNGPTSYGNGVTLDARGGNDVALVSFDPAGQARWGVLLGSSGHDSAGKLAIDASGNLFIVGTSRATPFWLSPSDSLSTTGGFLASYTSAGVYRWSRAMASEARSVAVSPSGNVSVSGWANGAFDYGLGVQQARGSGDLFLVTYSNDGQTTRWAHVYGADPAPLTPDSSFDDLVYDSSGNLYGAGHLGGPNGDVGGAVLPYAGQVTALLASYDPEGLHRWSKSLVASGTTYVDSAAAAIAVDGAGHLATFIRFRDTINLGGGALTTPSPGDVGSGGLHVGVLGVFAAADGALVAQRGFLTGAPVTGNDVAYDAAGNLLVAGNVNNGGADFGGGSTPGGAFVAGYDGALHYRFAKVARGGSTPSAQALVLADDGDVYAAGAFANTTLSWGVGTVSGGGTGDDVWLARLHPLPPVTSGLVAHYSAREFSGVSLTGASVDTWNDLSGGGHHLAPNSLAPTWVAAALNGHPALDFATGRGLISQPFTLTTNVTVLMLVAWGSAPDMWGNLAHHGNRDMDWSLEQVDTTPNTLHFQSSNDNAGVQLVCQAAEPMLLVGTLEGTTRTLRLVDSTGDRQVSGSGVTISSGDRVLWVGRSDIGESSNALIGEILYFNRALSAAETNQLVTDLTAAWGIAHP